MKIIFHPFVLQKNNREDKKTAFKAIKKISPEKLQRIIAERAELSEALKANFIVGKIDLNTPKYILAQKFCKMFSELAPVQMKSKSRVQDCIYNINDENVGFLSEIESRFAKFEIMEAFAKFSNPKSIPFLENYIALDYDTKHEENYIAKLDYLNFVANNIEGAEFNEGLFRFTRELEPTVLPLAKHLTNIFPNDYSEIGLHLSSYKSTFLYRANLFYYLLRLNEEDLDTNKFLQLIELIKVEQSDYETPEIIWDNIFESKIQDVDIVKVRSEVYEEYANKKMEREQMSFYMRNMYSNFIRETSHYLKEYGDNIHPLLLKSFITHVRPNNFDVVEYLSSKHCSFKDLEVCKKLISTVDNDIDYSNYLEMLMDMQVQGLDDKFIIKLTQAYSEALKYLSHDEKKEVIQKVINLRNKVKANPEKYISNNADWNEDLIFDLYTAELAKMVYVYDDNTVEKLFSRRLNNVDSFLHSFRPSPKNLVLLKELVGCSAPNGKSLTTTEKFNLGRMISVFNDEEIRNLEDIALTGVVDLASLKKEYFHRMLKSLGFKEFEIAQIPDEKFDSWDITYLPMTTQASRTNREVFLELFRANFSDNFIEYIHQENIETGRCNLSTKRMFEENGINYEKWIKPNKENEVNLLFVDSNRKRLERCVQELMENINVIRQSPLKSFFDKRFSDYIKADKFILPESLTGSVEKLEAFVKNLIVQLEPAWKRAKANLDKKDCASKIYEQATNTLTIKGHFLEIQNEVSNFCNVDFDRTLDLKIKMWDRIPSKDLFQGNYSDCCIALDRENGHVMPDYLLNTSFNMIEILDNSTGQIVGNALCFIAKNTEGKPSFVIDNIELANKYKLSEKASKHLFDALHQYVSNVCRDVSKEQLPIYMGRLYNDLRPNAKFGNQKLGFLGKIDASEIYLDVYGGWIGTQKLKGDIKVYHL